MKPYIIVARMLFISVIVGVFITTIAKADDFGAEICLRYEDTFEVFSKEGTFIEAYNVKESGVWEYLLLVPFEIDSGFAFKAPTGAISIFLFHQGCLAYNVHFEDDEWVNIRAAWEKHIYGPPA
tara:strand:+ start:15373 stop:15744 length:372 start_codon:yes stop_codon:yes gene_type:complete